MSKRTIWVRWAIYFLGALFSIAGHGRTIPAQAQQPPAEPVLFEDSLLALPPAQPWRSGDPVREAPSGALPSRTLHSLGVDSEAGPIESWDEALQLDIKGISGATEQSVQLSTPLQNFDAIPFTGFVPPDTQGDVGPNHYIQVVNAQFQIFDKEGNPLLLDDFDNPAPRNINSLWSNSNQQNCRDNNAGDPIVLYDHLADRWLLSQFAVPTGFSRPPTFQCIAISRGPDPVNDGWFLYEFPFDFGHDYPKLGVWPDGYYMSSQQGFPNGGLNAVVFDRANMLDGNAATFQLRQIAGPAITFLPSDLDGPPPPTDTPNYFARQVDSGYLGGVRGNDRVEIWEFSVDWINDNNTTFTLTRSLETATFDERLCVAPPPGVSDNDHLLFQICIPQPDTAQLLEALTVWPMFRLQYRSFLAFDTLVFNHTVNTGDGVAGIRWYELHTDFPGSGTWEIFQQGTFAPESDLQSQPEHRWMGSIAMDRFGNLALGYSVSSENLIANGDDVDGYPSVRYAGRLVDDPLGLLPHGEITVVQGTGFQDESTVGRNGPTRPARWGDYSSMSVDPVDDCTFWYTQEYLPLDGRWRTRVAAFRFSDCEPAIIGEADLSVTKRDSRNRVRAGRRFNYIISVENAGPAEAQDIVVTDTLPAGVRFAFARGVGWNCERAGREVTCAWEGGVSGVLGANDATAPLIIRVRVNRNLNSRRITNVVEVESSTSDPNQDNNRDRERTRVLSAR